MFNALENIKPDKKTTIWILLFSLAFLGINLYLISVKQTMLFSLFPIFLILIYLYLFALDKVLILTAFLAPLSINLNDFDYNIALSLPTEPLLAGILLLWVIYSLHASKPWLQFRKHPISIAFYIYFMWLFISAVTSQMPLVSWKFFLSHLWLIVPLYFFGTKVFYEKPKLQNTFVFVQIIALTIVILYTLLRHSTYAFADQEGQWVMQPFFKNHAMYGAAISLFIPVLFIFATDKKRSLYQRVFLILTLLIFITGLIFTYSRAAWLGFLVSVTLGIIIWLRIKFKYLLLAFFAFIVLAFVFQNQIINSLEKNEQDSSGNVSKNIESISNISTDASNLERLNRWSCAIRMTADYPMSGTGPGTYQFLYAPYQLSRELTVISTNAGSLGNAHSEFLGPMAETGIPGMLSVVFLVFIIFYTGFKTYIILIKTDLQKAKILLGLILGLVAYFVHGIMNNYLDSAKLAIPVWGFTAIIVAINLQLREKNKAG